MKQTRQDLTGQKFGRLTVLELSSNKTKSRGRKWICQCKCGTIKEISQLALLRGATISCRCYNREQLSKRNLKDLTGQTFGRWTVIERAERPPHVTNITGSWWLCECGCEKHTKKVVRGSSLTSGKSKSCGCLHKEKVGALHFADLTGSIFGNLTVIKQADAPETNKNKFATYWLCRCNCGNEVVVIAANLNNGHTTSCGCVNSKGEKKIIQILNENNISFVHDRGVFKDCKLSTGGTARFDFYVNDSYVIEYDGEIHYEGCNSGWYTQNRFEQTLQRDKEKNEYCWNHNIPIIRIPYWERDNITINDLRLETTRFLYTPESINQNN
jgi:CDGSH-type Zn-finger protein